MKWVQYLHQSVTNAWYRKSTQWTLGLLPLSALFRYLAERRKKRYLQSSLWQPPVPIVVVGNISVGGTGKTPVVAALVRVFEEVGLKPGVISRGFGAKGAVRPVTVLPDSDPALVGDEPVMLSNQLNIPLVVDPNRVLAAQYLLSHHQCDVILADDGLQHYALQRDVEVVVIDGERMLGNGYCLPAGPLRESLARLHTVDAVLVNGGIQNTWPKRVKPVDTHDFHLCPDRLQSVNPHSVGLEPQKGTVHAVAGIGNPERFFRSLTVLGYDVIPHPFPDHHGFVEDDILFDDSWPVIMTAKDAIKCRRFASEKHWYLPVTAQLPEPLVTSLVHRVHAVRKAKGKARVEGGLE